MPSWLERQTVNRRLSKFTISELCLITIKGQFRIPVVTESHDEFLVCIPRLQPQATTKATVTKRHLKSEFALLQTLSRLFQPVEFFKCWHIFLELSYKRLYES